MNDEGYLLAMLVVCVVALAIVLTFFLTSDFRHFNRIVKQCDENGFIQNETIRVICHREEKK